MRYLVELALASTLLIAMSCAQDEEENNRSTNVRSQDYETTEAADNESQVQVDGDTLNLVGNSTEVASLESAIPSTVPEFAKSEKLMRCSEFKKKTNTAAVNACKSGEKVPANDPSKGCFTAFPKNPGNFTASGIITSKCRGSYALHTLNYNLCNLPPSTMVQGKKYTMTEFAEKLDQLDTRCWVAPVATMPTAIKASSVAKTSALLQLAPMPSSNPPDYYNITFYPKAKPTLAKSIRVEGGPSCNGAQAIAGLSANTDYVVNTTAGITYGDPVRIGPTTTFKTAK